MIVGIVVVWGREVRRDGVSGEVKVMGIGSL